MDYWFRFLTPRISRRRTLAGLAAGSIGAAVLAACGGGSDKKQDADTVSRLVTQAKDESAAVKRGGIFKHYLAQDFATYDPQSLGGNAGTTFRVYTGLMRQKEGVLEPPSGEIEGDVAQSWELSPDRLTLTLKINPNTHWPPQAPLNGRPADAEDVAFSWQRYKQMSNRRGEFANEVDSNAPIVSITALDKSTVQIKLAFPYAPIYGLLGVNFLGAFFILPKEAGDPNAINIARTVAGTGPWYLAEYQPSVSAIFRRNAGYQQVRGNLPYMDEMQLPIISEYAAGLAQFKTGNIYSYAVNAEDLIPTKKDRPEIEITSGPSLASTLWHVIFGRKDHFVDQRLRQAYVMTWDRDAFIDTFYNVSAFESQGLPMQTAWESAIQANFWRGWFLNAKDEKSFGPNAKYFKKDLAEARKLVTAAGFADGVPTTIHYPEPGINPQWTKFHEVVTGFVEESKLFKTKREPHNRASDFIPNFQAGKGNFDGLAHYYANQPQDPTIYLYSFYHPSGGQVGLTDDKFADIINRSLREFDLPKRKELTLEAQRYEGEKQFFPRMGAATSFLANWPVLRNVNVFSGTAEDYARWFIDSARPPLKSN
jgi:ABC-type transport system substrate-binding protein